MAGIHAIKTEYRGVLFMSNLEADWAKTLDTVLGRMVWQYEPLGIKLPDGQNYRCDFFLPRIGTWLEVKGPHDERIDKPGLLADALTHAPGCDRGRPIESLTRPAGAPAASCACGFGDDFPYQLLVVGRPANAGRLTFEPPHGHNGAGAKLVVLKCKVCQQFSFADANSLLLCRRCHQDATGSKAHPSGSLPFAKVEPPRGGRRGGASAAKRSRKAA